MQSGPSDIFLKRWSMGQKSLRTTDSHSNVKYLRQACCGAVFSEASTQNSDTGAK